MKQNKKIVSVILSGLLCISLLSGCQNTSMFENKDEETVKIVSTIFPQYDWVREMIEGMQEEEEEDESEEQEYDEHVWMSLRNAELICESIKDVLIEVLPDQAETYEKNAQAYIGKLAEADEKRE